MNRRILFFLLVLAAVVPLVRHAVGADSQRNTRAAAATLPRSELAAVGGATLRLPADWRRLAGGEGFEVWGEAGRRHTVTLGTVPAAPQELALVVAQAAAGMRRQFPGQQAPTLLTLSGRDRDVQGIALDVESRGHRPVYVRQMWLRDRRARVDAIATWTSADGRWPVDPTTHLPAVHTDCCLDH